MKKIYALAFTIMLISCKEAIKKTSEKVIVEKGTSIDNQPKENLSSTVKKTVEINDEDQKRAIGSWVGYFRPKDDSLSYDTDKYYLTNDNKINISIDFIKDSIVTGHSVVAGNDRPFTGVVKQINSALHFVVEEPGDNKYDGRFVFKIQNNKLTGLWSAFKPIRIKNRKYTLEKKNFKYDPNIMLEENSEFIDYAKSVTTKELYKGEEGNVEEWVRTDYAMTTDQIYLLNASNTILTKEIVGNLTKSDIRILRNTIYARHGYSFKNRVLRIFFDSQDWYVPIYANIKTAFTDIEKKNIEMLLKYEKNAVEYYDSFGR